MNSTALSMTETHQREWDRDTVRAISSAPFNETEDQLQHAIHECDDSPSFDNAEQVCLACRTSFMVFSHEYITLGREEQTKLLSYMLSLLGYAQRVVKLSGEQILHETPEERVQIGRISEYLRHIEDRIFLAELIRNEGMDAFKAELDRRIQEISSRRAVHVSASP